MSHPVCTLCGEPMPAGEEMFKFHGYSGPCPKPPLPSKDETRSQPSVFDDRRDLDDDLPESVRRELMQAAVANGRVSYGWLGAIYRRGRTDGMAEAMKVRDLLREWQEARKPAKLAEPGVELAATYQAAVKRMTAADEALAAYDLNGPAGGALVGQTEPTKSTGIYHQCACTCGCVDQTIRPGRCMVCRVRESCLKNEWMCEACASYYRRMEDGLHYNHNDALWGMCRKVIAESKRERSEAP